MSELEHKIEISKIITNHIKKIKNNLDQEYVNTEYFTITILDIWLKNLKYSLQDINDFINNDLSKLFNAVMDADELTESINLKFDQLFLKYEPIFKLLKDAKKSKTYIDYEQNALEIFIDMINKVFAHIVSFFEDTKDALLYGGNKAIILSMNVDKEIQKLNNYFDNVNEKNSSGIFTKLAIAFGLGWFLGSS